MKFSHFVGTQWIVTGMLALAFADTARAQLCKSNVFDTPTYTTSGGTQGAGSLVGQDSWVLGGGGTPTNAMMAITNFTAFSSTQSLKVTSVNTGVPGNLCDATKTFTGCGT